MKTTVPITIKNSGAKKGRIVRVEFNADRFERVAAALGMFSEEFLDSLDRAEKDIKAGRVHRAKSLRFLM